MPAPANGATSARPASRSGQRSATDFAPGIASYFPRGLDREALLRAPAITFGSSDTLHTNFLASRFTVAAGEFPSMTVPSVHSLLHCIQGGLGYGICPELQWEEMLAAGALIVPNKPVANPPAGARTDRHSAQTAWTATSGWRTAKTSTPAPGDTSLPARTAYRPD